MSKLEKGMPVYVLGGIEDGVAYPVGAYGLVTDIDFDMEYGELCMVRTHAGDTIWTSRKWLRTVEEMKV